MKKTWTTTEIVELDIMATANEFQKEWSIDDWTTNGAPVTDGKTGWGFANAGSGTGSKETYEIFNK